MESPNVARSLYVYKISARSHRQIIKQFSLLESSELKSWHNLTSLLLPFFGGEHLATHSGGMCYI